VFGPLVHVYVSVPNAVNVIELPLQIVALLVLRVNVGFEFTATVIADGVLKHPAILVPVTVYTVVDDGLTTVLVMLAPVFINVYVFAPLGVKVAVLPKQILVLLALKATVGVVLTVIVIDFMPLTQLLASLPLML
jgi:hypothetical protein